jgi:exodeoxyribonuclease V beta subunit
MPSSRVEETARLKNISKGIILTSYSRIKQGDSWSPPPHGDNVPEELRGEEAAEHTSPEEQQESASELLPGGRETGIYLHALLEETPPPEVLEYSFEEWSNSELVLQRARDLARQYAYREKYIAGALKLVYGALRSPLHACASEGNEQLNMPGGIASAERYSREMSFIYPIPEKFHPLLCNVGLVQTKPDQAPFQVGRGYLQGLIDLVFYYNNRYYLLDWKSDRLPLFNCQKIEEHVERNYKLQAIIYSLAVTRLLKIIEKDDFEKHFGGVLYTFLRGVEQENSQDYSRAVWFSRPSYNTLKEWENSLLQRNEWGA